MDANDSMIEAPRGGAPGEQDDWRTQLRPDLRQRIVNDILETLKRHLPYSDAEGLQDLKEIAVRFEEKFFAAASSQPDYLRRFSFKMLTMENKSQNTIPNAMLADASIISNRLPDTAEGTRNSGLVQPSLMQSASVMQQHQQNSVTRQQQDVLIHLQQSQMMRQLANVADTQQIQLMGQQNNNNDIEQQQQREIQQRFQILQQLHQQQQLQQQQKLQQHQHQQQLQQQQLLMAQQSNISNMHQQQLVARNILVLHHQLQQVLGSEFGNSDMPTNQHSVHMLQQPQVPTQQQPQPSGTGLLASQGLQSQSQAPRHQLVSQMQHQPSLQQQANPVQRGLQQRIEGPAQVTGSLDPATQSGQVNGGDWQEECYQKVVQMREKYFAKLTEMHHKLATKLEKLDSQQPNSYQLHKLKLSEQDLERLLHILQTPRSSISLGFKEKLVAYERQIQSILTRKRPAKQKKEGLAQPKEPLPSPNEPTLGCPICLGPLVKETTTKCGHIFCEKCIKAALKKKLSCPTCRNPVVVKDLMRIFLGTNTFIV